MSQLLVYVLPFIFLFFERNRLNYYRIFIFLFYYIIALLFLNRNIFPPFDIGKWYYNWNDKWIRKGASIIFSIICYFIFKKYFKKYNYIKIKQEWKNIKIILLVSFITIISNTTYSYYFSPKDTFNFEMLIFYLTIPGIDEEIMYRGILLGLLLSCLKKKVYFVENIGIIIIAILFGLIHALKINEISISYISKISINFNIINFIRTVIIGYILGWITIKSKSILIPILVHNFINFFATLLQMIK
jgi:membrane protease YdiL (CAAX protease family)